MKREIIMKLKQLTVCITVLTLFVGLVSCGDGTDNTSSQAEYSSAAGMSSTDESPTEEISSVDAYGSLREGELEDILAAIYAAAEDTEEIQLNHRYLETTEIDPDDCFYYFGVESLDFEEGIASEYSVGGAYSLCLIRAKSLDDVDELKRIIAENADPWKWFCTGVDEDKIVVDNIGDVIILIMYEKSELLHDIFLDLAGTD